MDLDLDRCLQPEDQRRFRRQLDFLFPRRSRRGSARARSGRRADGSSLAAAGNAPDNGPQRRSATNDFDVARLVRLPNAAHSGRLELIAVATDLYRIQGEDKPRHTFEPS